MREDLTPQAQLRMEQAGEPAPSGYPSWSVYRHEQILANREWMDGQGGTSLADGQLVTWLFLRTLPFLLAAVATIVLAGWIVEHSAGYRDLLETFLPDDVIATVPGGDGKPGVAGSVIGGLLGLVVVGLTVARRRWIRSWAFGGSSTVPLTVWTFVLTALRTGTAIAIAPLVLGAAGIANASDLEQGSPAGPAGLQPYLVSLVPVVWFSIGSTRRQVVRALATRVAILEQMP